MRPRKDLPEKLEFAYSPLTKRDPLGYFSASPHPRKGNYFSFEEWNDFFVEQEHYYPNIPGGMGTYLYSTNPALGDVLVMHSQGWNFGAYAGNHGGIHRGEKKTFLLVSGPTVTEGPLMARDVRGRFHYPTLLDMAPTALEWLGYGPKALTRFSREHFAIYLEEWRKNQRQEATAYYTKIPDFSEFLEEFSPGIPEAGRLSARGLRSPRIHGYPGVPPSTELRASRGGRVTSMHLLKGFINGAKSVVVDFLTKNDQP